MPEDSGLELDEDDEIVTFLVTVAPDTITDPEEGLAVYPDGAVMVKEYVPFGSSKDIAAEVSEWVVPPSTTVQVALAGRPLAWNVTPYTGMAAVNVMFCWTADPFTVTGPEEGLAV